MKIGINLTREKVGGITSSNLNLLNYLYKLNYEFIGLELSTKIHSEGPALFRSFAPETFDHHIINIHHLPLTNILKRSVALDDVRKSYLEPIRIIRKILRETRPNVMLISGTSYTAWLISIAAKREKIPVVLWYSGIISKEIAHYKSIKVKRMFLWVEKEMVKLASEIIFPSELCKKVVEEDITKRKIKKSYILPNPVSNTFTDPIAQEPSRNRSIAAIGRYSLIKNFDKFFEIHLELLRRGWEHKASFVTNPDANLEKMPKTIELLPSMTQEQLKKFYLSQGVIICPSIFETFGNVPMEASCLGIPVLVNETMGCAEILRKAGLANMVISFDDINKVADRVQELCGQSILLKQLNSLKALVDINTVSEEMRIIIDGVAANGHKKKNSPAGAPA